MGWPALQELAHWAGALPLVACAILALRRRLPSPDARLLALAFFTSFLTDAIAARLGAPNLWLTYINAPLQFGLFLTVIAPVEHRRRQIDKAWTAIDEEDLAKDSGERPALLGVLVSPAAEHGRQPIHRGGDPGRVEDLLGQREALVVAELPEIGEAVEIGQRNEVVAHLKINPRRMSGLERGLRGTEDMGPRSVPTAVWRCDLDRAWRCSRRRGPRRGGGAADRALARPIAARAAGATPRASSSRTWRASASDAESVGVRS